MSKVILENVQVLAAGQNVTSDVNGKPQNVQVVTLVVTPEESQKLALASVDGKIQLALRNPLDLARLDPQAQHRDSLYGVSARKPEPDSKPAPVKTAARRVAPAPAPALPAPAPQPVAAPAPKFALQLIQGGKTESVIFEKKADSGPSPQNK